MKKCTKVLSVLLVLVLALSTMSMVAFAVDTTAVATNLRWDTAVEGKALWDAVEGATGYNLFLYQDGVEKPMINSTGTAKALINTMKTYGSGSYTFAVRAKFSGNTYGPLSEQSAPFVYTAPAKPITSVQLTGVDTPSDGMVANFTCNAPSGSGYKVVAAYWAEAATLPTTAYEMAALPYVSDPFNYTAKYYVFSAEVKADEGYKFEDNMTATINYKSTTKFIKSGDDRVLVYLAFETTPATLISVDIVSVPKKIEYKLGESISTEGIQVVATYSNNSTVDITDKVSYVNFNTDEAGENKEARVEYSEGGITLSDSFTYTVTEKGAAGGGFFGAIANFFASIINFFRNLFK